jgi:hypothetical protein
LERLPAQDAAIKALTAALAPKAKALRDGKLATIEAINLVPGGGQTPCGRCQSPPQAHGMEVTSRFGVFSVMASQEDSGEN